MTDRTLARAATVKWLEVQMREAVRLFNSDPRSRRSVLAEARRVADAELRDERIVPRKGIV